MSMEIGSQVSPVNTDTSRKYIELASQITRFEDRDGSLQKMDELMKGGAFPIFAANHNRTFNMYNFDMVARRLQHMPDTTYMVMAATLLSGHQGERAKVLTEGFAEVLREDKIEFLPIFRGEPDFKYVTDEKDRPEFERQSARNVLEFMRNLNSNIGLQIFLEGGVDGGRMKPFRDHHLPWGRRRGTQEVQNVMVPTVLRRLRKLGRDVAIMSVTNKQTYRIVPESRRRPTALAAVTYGLHKLGVEVYATSTIVQEPITFSDFERVGIDVDDKDQAEAINRAIMEIVVDPLPKNDRGFYR